MAAATVSRQRFANLVVRSLQDPVSRTLLEEARKEKDRAIVGRAGERLAECLARLRKRLATAKSPVDRDRVNQQLGRMLAKHSRASRKFVVEVHACPVRFMKELEFAIDKGDTVTVVGSRPEAGGVVVAREVTKGQTSLILRDKTGAPVWTGR